MKKCQDKAGIAILEVIIVFIAVSIVGMLAFTFYNGHMNELANTSQTQSSQSIKDEAETSIPEINSVSDLDEAESILDDTDINSVNNDDINKLDVELSNF